MKYSFMTLAIVLCCSCCLAGVGQGNAPAKQTSAFEQMLIDSEKVIYCGCEEGRCGFF